MQRSARKLPALPWIDRATELSADLVRDIDAAGQVFCDRLRGIYESPGDAPPSHEKCENTPRYPGCDGTFASRNKVNIRVALKRTDNDGDAIPVVHESGAGID